MSTFISLLLLWAGHFLVDFMLGIWSVYKTMSFLDLGIAGAIAAFCAFSGEGAQLIFGNLSDKGYRNRLILLGILLTSANLFLAFSGASYSFVLTFLMLTCIGSGAFHPAAVSYIGSLTESRKGLYIAIFSSGGALGMAVSQLIFTRTHAYFSGNTTPLIIPGILLVFIMLLFGFLKKTPEEKSISHGAFDLRIFKEYFKDPHLRNLYITQVCNQTMFWGLIFLLPDILLSRGYGEGIAFGGGHFAFIFGGFSMMIPSGYLADRFSAKSVILFFSLLGMLFFYAFLLIPNLSNITLLTVLFLSGAFMGVVQPVAVALGNFLGRKNPGKIGAFTMGLVWCLSETIGPLGSGLLSKAFIEDAPAKALMVFGLLFPILLSSAYQLPKQEPVLEPIN